MRKLILNMLVVVLLLTALATVAINVSFADNQINCIAGDPNDEPEYISLANSLDDDPNDEPERMLSG